MVDGDEIKGVDQTGALQVDSLEILNRVIERSDTIFRENKDGVGGMLRKLMEEIGDIFGFGRDFVTHEHTIF